MLLAPASSAEILGMKSRMLDAIGCGSTVNVVASALLLRAHQGSSTGEAAHSTAKL
jgi:hypothetical protein